MIFDEETNRQEASYGQRFHCPAFPIIIKLFCLGILLAAVQRPRKRTKSYEWDPAVHPFLE